MQWTSKDCNLSVSSSQKCPMTLVSFRNDLKIRTKSINHIQVNKNNNRSQMKWSNSELKSLKTIEMINTANWNERKYSEKKVLFKKKKSCDRFKTNVKNNLINIKQRNKMSSGSNTITIRRHWNYSNCNLTRTVRVSHSFAHTFDSRHTQDTIKSSRLFSLVDFFFASCVFLFIYFFCVRHNVVVMLRTLLSFKNEIFFCMCRMWRRKGTRKMTKREEKRNQFLSLIRLAVIMAFGRWNDDDLNASHCEPVSTASFFFRAEKIAQFHSFSFDIRFIPIAC